MATLIVKHPVADFNQWKKVFDGMHETRLAHGFTEHQVLRDPTDANLVTIISRVRSAEDAKAYGQSPVLKEAMKNAGVIGAPHVELLNDEEIKTY
ncbi:MAG TPA: antibiotic biosynthesis monooxygenase [Bacteroidia bacterium]|nr:antibiotic biosynthesis monooxygenase [Bacteroidia bacterium]